MLVGKKYKVESDTMNVILYEKEITIKNGDIHWRPMAYFSNIKYALRYLVNLELKTTGLKDLETVNRKQDEILALINNLKL
jgi:hypothetical protein